MTWSLQLSKSKGMHYWFNSKTGARAWTEKGLPEHWGFEWVDGKKSYFHVEHKGQATFTKPSAGASGKIDSLRCSHFSQHPRRSKRKRLLPAIHRKKPVASKQRSLRSLQRRSLVVCWAIFWDPCPLLALVLAAARLLWLQVSVAFQSFASLAHSSAP